MSKDKLADKFGLSPITKTDVEIVNENEVFEISGSREIDDDFEQAQKFIKNQMVIGSEAIQEMLELAKTSQSPRAFEVLATLLKTNKELAETILQNHATRTKVTGESQTKSPQTVNNNAIFCGSMKELMETLKKKNDN